MVISHSFYKRLPEGSAAGALATIMGMFHDVPRNISWLKSAPNIYRSPSYIIQHIHTYPKLHRMTMYDYRCHFLDTHTDRDIYIYIYTVYLYIYIIFGLFVYCMQCNGGATKKSDFAQGESKRKQRRCSGRQCNDSCPRTALG